MRPGRARCHALGGADLEALFRVARQDVVRVPGGFPALVVPRDIYEKTRGDVIAAIVERADRDRVNFREAAKRVATDFDRLAG